MKRRQVRHGQVRHSPPVRGRPRLANARIALKLTPIVALPLVAVLALGAVVVWGSVGQATRAGQARNLVALAADASDVVRTVQRERAAAAVLLSGTAGSGAVDTFNRLAAVTDTEVHRYQQLRGTVGAPEAVDSVLRRVDAQLGGLEALRRRVVSTAPPSLSATVFGYRIVVAGLLDFRQAVALVGVAADVANHIRAGAALSQAGEFLALEQVGLVRAAAFGTMTPAVQQDVLAARAGYADALQQFGSLGEPAWAGWYAATVTGGEVVTAEQLEGEAAGVDLNAPLRLDIDTWIRATSARADLINAVQQRVDAAVLNVTTGLRNTQFKRAGELTAGVLAVALLAALIAVGAARHLSRRLQSLRHGALAVADRLPMVVADLGLLQRGAASRVSEASADAVRPISVDGRDEVGQVAGAFGQVCTVAVEQAGQQALLRAGMAATLVAVARRVQTLFGGLTAMLDHLERDERDTERLAAFFQVDHSVTVANRYTAGLLVLAGVSPGRVRQQPAPLADVLRAGQSQARGYQRVRLGDIPPVWVPADRIDHLAHLVAELVDNATSYSAPSTTVTVGGWDLHGRVVIQIRDEGVGMPAAQVVAANALLRTPDADTGGSRQIGLPVIARLAAWAGVQVALRPAPDVGLIAEVTVPATALTGPPPGAVPLPATSRAAAGASQAVAASAGSAMPATWPPIPAGRLSPVNRAAAPGRVGPPNGPVPTSRPRPAVAEHAGASAGAGQHAGAGQQAGAGQHAGVGAAASAGVPPNPGTAGGRPAAARPPAPPAAVTARVGLPARRRGAYLPDMPQQPPRRVLTDADLSPQAVAAAVSTAARALADLQRTHFPTDPVRHVSAVQEHS